MSRNSKWVWSKNCIDKHETEPFAIFFRKKINLANKSEKAIIKISADSRYKLYVNEKFVEQGPSKGDTQIWFYDELDISKYLIKGDNVISVIVLRFPQKPTKGNQSILSTNIPGLYVEGEIQDGKNAIKIDTDETWKTIVDTDTKYLQEQEGFAPLYFYEHKQASDSLWQWQSPQYDDSKWEDALPYPKGAIRDAVSPGNLNPRTIPFMKRTIGRFKQTLVTRKSIYDKSNWNDMLLGNADITIPPNTEEIVEIDTGELMTGYLHLIIEGGKNAKIELLQSEAYVLAEGDNPHMGPVKGDRLDFENGYLTGFTDYYEPSGKGSEECPEEYTPFWFRTFRFIRLSVKTGNECLTIKDFYFEETGYPLEVKTSVTTSDETLTEIWDISLRTLKRCMHETYTDCPFYEQLQYVMDSRSQILYTYSLSLDDRLARKCIDDFKRAQRYDGLISSAYPNTKPNVIPGFSIYYILMIHDHMMYFGDEELLKYYMPSVQQILNFYESNIQEEGYVGKLGGFHRQEKFWSFVDWVPEWPSGVPNASAQGPITMESLLYVMGLQKAAELFDYIDNKEIASNYRTLAKKVQAGLRKHCMDENGALLDGPNFHEYSQHCQVFGILTDTLTIEEGRKVLFESLQDESKYRKCTVSNAFYLFRALEKTDLYEHTNKLWDVWREMIKNNLTTVQESDQNPRSECHAWGSLILYELPAVVLGIRPTEPGFKNSSVSPVKSHLDFAIGKVITPNGVKDFSI